VLGLSLDYNDKLWKNAIDKIQMTWPQLCVLKDDNFSLHKAYNFIGIPYTVLIDHQGRIVFSKFLTGEQLKEFLSKLFKE
jgi:hypothetical protein